MATTKDIANLVINKVESQAVYDYMENNDLINEDELYFVEGTEEYTLEFDDVLTDESDNAVKNRVIKAKFDEIESVYETKDEASAKLDTAKAYTDTVGDSKQDKLSGTQGQIVGFDESGNAVAQDIPQSDWNQNDESAPDYIKNKPLVSVGGDTLTWDGNTEGLESVDMGNGSFLYKISDATPSLSEAQQGFAINMGSETQEYTGESIVSLNETIYAFVNIDFGMVVLADNVDFFGLVIPFKGVYFLNTPSDGYSLTIPGYTGFAKKQINPELLPMTTVTIPAGRMRGDIDGDGKITEADVDVIAKHLGNVTPITDATKLECADFDGDGSVSTADNMYITRISRGHDGYTPGLGGDILNNWTVNPNYATEDMQFYIDISVPGLTTNSSAVVTIHGTFETGFFEGECVANTLRLYAKLCPIAETKAVVNFGTGDGTVVCVCEGTEVGRDSIITATIPKGRMKGDVDGDGEITENDYAIAMAHIQQETLITDSIAFWTADLDDTGEILLKDAMPILQFANKSSTSNLTKKPYFADYYNNWTYVKVDDFSGYFYTDISVPGVKSTSSAKITVKGSHNPNMFKDAECLDGIIRVKAFPIPIEEATCLVQYGTGDGSAVITVEKIKVNGNVGDFVVIGADGNLTTKTIAIAEEASF